MATQSIQRHHKRKKKKSEQKSKIDYLIYFAATIGPVLTIPQVYTIWVDKQPGVSIITWGAYLVSSIIWLIYGLKHNDKPIIYTEIAWILLAVAIIIGIMKLS